MEHTFVADGGTRLAAAIRAEVVAEFASELSAASFWQRFRIRRAMNAEVKRRIQQQAPRDALYALSRQRNDEFAASRS